MPRHPVQPVVIVKKVARFKANEIVKWLLDRNPYVMNEIALLGAGRAFTRDDQQQFAQLIGYSVDGYRDLSYHDRKIGHAAQEKVNLMIMKKKRGKK